MWSRFAPRPRHHGITYTVRVLSCGRNNMLDPWGIAEGLGHLPAPATVASLRADGTIEKNELFLKSSQECRKALKPDSSPIADRST